MEQKNAKAIKVMVLPSHVFSYKILRRYKFVAKRKRKSSPFGNLLVMYVFSIFVRNDNKIAMCS